MKNRHLIKVFTSLIVISMGLTSCVEKVNLDTMDTNASINPSLGLPIGSVHAYMTDLLSFVDSTFVGIDKNEGLYVFFEQDGVNLDFAVDQFGTGEKLDETLTLSRIPEVNMAFQIINQYITDFNEKIDIINHILSTGKIDEEITYLEEPEGIVLPDEYRSYITMINQYIDQLNELVGMDINSLPNEIKDILKEIGAEINKIGKLERLDDVTLPETEFTFTQESKYNFGFNEFIEGEKSIRIDSAVIIGANVDFELFIDGIDFTKGDYILLKFDYPHLFQDSIQDRFETVKITDNRFVFSESLDHFMAYFDEINEKNEIDLAIHFTFVSTGSLTISKDATIRFQTEINLINFEEIYGHIWQKDEFQSGEIAFDVPSSLVKSDLITNNNILLSNPQINVKFNHNVGIPMLLKIDNFYYEKNGEKFNLDNNDATHNIELEIRQPEKIHEFSTSEIKLDNTNSPIAELIQKIPERIGVTWHVITPYSDNEDSHYLVNPIQANMDLDVTVPFQFDATTQITYTDTIPADITSTISDITDIAQVDTLCLYLDITSALPATVGVKLLFLDDEFNLIRESTPFEITSAEVDELGKVKTPTIQSKTIQFGNDLVEDIVNTKNIMFEVRLKGYDNSSKIYIQSTDKIDIDLSVFAKAKINLTSGINN